MASANQTDWPLSNMAKNEPPSGNAVNSLHDFPVRYTGSAVFSGSQSRAVHGMDEMAFSNFFLPAIVFTA